MLLGAYGRSKDEAMSIMPLSVRIPQSVLNSVLYVTSFTMVLLFALSFSTSQNDSHFHQHQLIKNQNFLELQSQLEGTENRINVERNRFNELVKTFNTAIKRFPQNIFAGIFGFSEKGYFKADAGSENVPKVEF